MIQLNTTTRSGNDFALEISPTVALIFLIFSSLFGTAVDAQNDPGVIPLIEQEPFDVIQLDEFNGNVELKIVPLDRPLSNPLPGQGVLVFEAPELSDDRLQIPFSNLRSYRSYNDLLREEANQFIRNEEFGKAFRNLLYVYDHGGKNDPVVTDLIQNLLFRDGAKNYSSGNYELALSIFQDIYERDKNFRAPGIGRKPVDLILDCLNKNIQEKFERQQYAQVLASINDLELRYDDGGQRLANQWRQRLLAESDRFLNEARQLAQAGNGKEAHLLARKANSVVPGRPESSALLIEIVRQYPLILVGVGQTSEFADPLSMDHWAMRRIGRLTERTIVEFVGPGDDGGEYRFSNGTLEALDDNGFEYRLLIDPENKGFAVPPIDAYQMTRKLLARGNVNADGYFVPFARIVDSIEIDGEFSVIIRLKQAFIKFPALLLMTFDQSSDAGQLANGPYVLAEKQNDFLIFEKNDRYPDLPGRQHPQIIEWNFGSASSAASALVRGEVDVVDRILPADLNRIEANAQLKVEPYIVPNVHMLIPNVRNAFMADRTFRNGLNQGINRELILRDVICGGNEVNGCEIISGPFPIGTEENDQLSYAYNLKVNPQPFNDRLGMVLARVVFETQRNLAISEGRSESQIDYPVLTLAHGDDEISQIACSNIQQMWQAMGLTVNLRELSSAAVPPDDDWDFLYYQMMMQEPLTDVERLFGRDGVVKSISAPVEQNMQQLGNAISWQNAGKTLRRIHRQVVNDVTIIPLWQIKEHFAYRKDVTGFGENPVNLYQHVEDWKIVAERGEE